MPDKENEQNITNTTDPCYNAFSEELKKQVPENVTFGLASPTSSKSKDEKVDTANDKAQFATINAYTNHELERVRRQKWLLGAVVLLTAGQLIFFNYMIYMTVSQSFLVSQLETINIDVVNNLFDILKYYIGATVVELIGMILFITKGTFSSDHVKTMELILKGKSKTEEATE